MNDLTPNILLPSDNEFEIPQLRMDMQPEFVDIPFVCFGEQKRTFQMNGQGTLHFYTDDYRFNAIFEHPERVLQHSPRNIVEPNFSMFNDMPVAFALQAVYKKRFIARAMQERGINVFVDLNVASKFYNINMLGIPHGYSSFCTRGYSDRLQFLEYEWLLARSYAGSNPLLFVIYGGGLECKRFAREKGCIYITPTVKIKKGLDAIKKIDTSIAFFGQEIKIGNALEHKEKDVLQSQVADFRKQKAIQ